MCLVASIAFSPDGTKLLTSAKDDTYVKEMEGRVYCQMIRMSIARDHGVKQNDFVWAACCLPNSIKEDTVKALAGPGIRLM